MKGGARRIFGNITDRSLFLPTSDRSTLFLFSFFYLLLLPVALLSFSGPVGAKRSLVRSLASTHKDKVLLLLLQHKLENSGARAKSRS